MKKILISTSTFSEYDKSPVEKLVKVGLRIEFNPYKRKLNLNETISLYKDKIGVIAGTELITKEVLENAKNLKIISRCGTGMDNIDHDTAKQLKIKILNTPDGPTLAVAELTVGLIFSLLRKIPEMDHEMRNNIWKKRMGNLLTKKTVGIIGYGKIGQKVGELLIRLGCSVLFFDTQISQCQHGGKFLSFIDVLKQSDIICLHVSGSFKDKPLIGDNEIEKIKKGAWLINCSRGGVVDEKVLYQALKTNHINGAAIDVFEQEPPPKNHPLFALPNILITPHNAALSLECRKRMAIEVCETVSFYLKDKEKLNIQNIINRKELGI